MLTSSSQSSSFFDFFSYPGRLRFGLPDLSSVRMFSVDSWLANVCSSAVTSSEVRVRRTIGAIHWFSPASNLVQRDALWLFTVVEIRRLLNKSNCFLKTYLRDIISLYFRFVPSEEWFHPFPLFFLRFGLFPFFPFLFCLFGLFFLFLLVFFF